MNICLVGFYQYPIPPLRGGSLAIVAHELLQKFAQKGHDISVFSVKDQQLPRYEEQQRIRYFRKLNPIFNNKNVFEQSISCLSYSLYTTIQMYHLHKIDLIQCFDPLLLLFLKGFNILKKKPVIIRFGMGFGLSHGWNVLKRPNWVFLGFADHVVVPSLFLKRSLITNLKLSEDQISVIPNGVNINKFDPDLSGEQMRRKYGLGDAPVILFVGRIVPEKGVDVLLETIPLVRKRIRDVKLLVVGPLGDKSYGVKLRSLVSKYRLDNVIFTGEVDVYKELPEIYAACNIFCCPSRKGEAFGNVVTEAMSSGKPVVVTDSGGLSELVEEGKTGYVVPSLQKQELAKTFIELLENEELQIMMGKAARRRAEKLFSWDKTAEEYLKLYEEVIKP